LDEAQEGTERDVLPERDQVDLVIALEKGTVLGDEEGAVVEAPVIEIGAPHEEEPLRLAGEAGHPGPGFGLAPEEKGDGSLGPNDEVRSPPRCVSCQALVGIEGRLPERRVPLDVLVDVSLKNGYAEPVRRLRERESPCSIGETQEQGESSGQGGSDGDLPARPAEGDGPGTPGPT